MNKEEEILKLLLSIKKDIGLISKVLGFIATLMIIVLFNL